MVFTNINKVARMADYLPTKKIIELEPLTYYKITAFRTANTKFGSKFMATINVRKHRRASNVYNCCSQR